MFWKKCAKIITATSCMVGAGIGYYKYKKNQDKIYYDTLLNDVYFGKSHRHPIIINNYQYDISNDDQFKNIRLYTFSPSSSIIYQTMRHFDENYINNELYKYLYGKYYLYSSMETTKITDDNPIKNLSNAITKYDVPHIRIIINENQCSETLLTNINNTNRITTTSNFLNEAVDSHLSEKNKKYAIHSIDLRECQTIDSKELENVINNSSEKVKILITNSKTMGKHTEKYLKDNFDELIFLGKHDEKIIENMRNVLGNDYVITKYPNIDNISKKLYNHNPKLFIKTITQGETIDMITNEEKYGKVAFVSADVEFGDRLPKASGGNYSYNIYDIQYTFSNLKDNKITSEFFDMMVEKKVDSVIFTCNHSRSRGPYFAQLFMNQCREKNHQFNIYIMYPGVGRIHDEKYNNAHKVDTIDLDKLFNQKKL